MKKGRKKYKKWHQHCAPPLLLLLLAIHGCHVSIPVHLLECHHSPLMFLTSAGYGHHVHADLCGCQSE